MSARSIVGFALSLLYVAIVLSLTEADRQALAEDTRLAVSASSIHSPPYLPEFAVDGKMVDIAYREDGKLIFVEVEHQSDWQGNIVRGVDLCDMLVSVSVRKSDCVKARSFLKEKGLAKVVATHVFSFPRLAVLSDEN